MQVFGLFDLDAPIHVVDIGASVLVEDSLYKGLFERGLARLSAFDGDSRQIGRIHAAYGAEHVRVFQQFLFDDGRHTVHVCHPESGMTSLFKPRAASLAFFNGFETFGEVLQTTEVQTA